MTTHRVADALPHAAKADPRCVRLIWCTYVKDDGQPWQWIDGATWDEIEEPVKAILRTAWDGTLRWPLLLQGRAGIGKDCVARVMSRQSRGEARTWTLPELIDHKLEHGLRETRAMVQRPMLVTINEVGERANPTDAELLMLHDVLDWREFRPLILITNRSAKWMEKPFGDPLMSRIFIAGTQITEDQFGTKDRREPEE